MKSNKLQLLLATHICLFLSAITQAATYNAANDFSATNNPNGVWQYGYEPTLGSPFVLFDTASNSSSLDFWTSAALGGIPTVLHNGTADPVAFADFTLGPNQAAFHPGASDYFAIYRWIAPSAGSFSIHGGFVGLGGDSSTVDVHVLVNGVEAFAGMINRPGETQSYDTIRTLSSGGIVDFAVGYGSNEFYVGDTTGINATVANVPEPSSMALLVGATGLLLLGRCRYFKSNA